MIRKTLQGLVVFAALILISVLVGLCAIFFQPQVVIHQSNIEKLLQRYAPITYQLSSFEFQHTYQSLFEREIKISLKDFIFEQVTQDSQSLKVKGELKDLEINFRVFYQNGFKVESERLNQIHFENLKIRLAQDTEAQKPENQAQEIIDIKKYYQQLWSEILPEIHLRIDQVQITQKEKTFEFPFDLLKRKKHLSTKLLEFSLEASPQKLTVSVFTPRQLWSLVNSPPLPKELEGLGLEINFHVNDQHHLLNGRVDLMAGKIDLQTTIPNQFDQSNLQGSLNQVLQKLRLQIDYPDLLTSFAPYLPKKSRQQIEKNQIHAALKSQLLISAGLLEDLKIEIKSLIDFDVKSTKLELVHQTAFEIDTDILMTQPQKLITQSALGTTAELKIEQITTKWKNFHENFFQLPAPLNSMQGDLVFLLSFSPFNQEDFQAHFDFTIELEGHQQNLKISSLSTLPLFLSNESSSVFGILQTQMNIDRVNLRLPHWQAQPSTPQFVADARIVKDRASLKTSKKKNPPAIDLDLHLKTQHNRPIKVTTNLLNSPIQLEVDLQVKGDQKSGMIKVLPLNLEIFKRKISLQELVITLDDPALPQIKGLVQFHLPQYLISLQLEGTSEQMRHHFTSSPPLPQSDIYAVLLFGRPMTELSGDDRAAANQTQQILSDGLLSLSVLYFLSGGPIQSIGFNPDAQSVSAQIGLSKNSSLNVSTSASGQNRASVRRSLGSGWYIDTSVQNSTHQSNTKQSDYGVLLEKIMAY